MDVATEAASSPAREILLKLRFMKCQRWKRLVPSRACLQLPRSRQLPASPLHWHFPPISVLMVLLFVCLAALAPLLALAYSDSSPILAWTSQRYETPSTINWTVNEVLQLRDLRQLSFQNHQATPLPINFRNNSLQRRCLRARCSDFGQSSRSMCFRLRASPPPKVWNSLGRPT